MQRKKPPKLTRKLLPNIESSAKTAAKTSTRPLWLFLCDPGASGLLTKELKFRSIIRQKTQTEKLFLRNYDLLVVPDSQIVGDIRQSRLAQHVMICPVFGRHRISENQLDMLAAAYRRENAEGFVSSVVGTIFQRQELLRWVSKQLANRGSLIKSDTGKRPLWLLAVDELFYFGFQKHNHHDAAGRGGDADRAGSLPATVGAAMIFAANPRPDEIVWDPVVGSGALLREALAMIPAGRFIASDIDPQAMDLAKQRLQADARVTFITGDARTLDPARSDISLTIANLPWGKQFVAEGGNTSFYEALLRNVIKYAAPSWRGCFLTSDLPALRQAVGQIETLQMQAPLTIQVRGTEAFICLVERGRAKDNTNFSKGLTG